MLYDKGKINAALIIAPKGVYQNWHDSEIPTHLVDHIDKKMVLWQAMITKTQEKKLNTLFAWFSELKSTNKKLAFESVIFNPRYFNSPDNHSLFFKFSTKQSRV